MRYILTLALVALTIISTLSAGTYVTNSGVTKELLTYANLSNANLSNANLSNANLSRAVLPDANLSNADLSYADLTYARLLSADLSGADLSGARLTNADFLETNLSGTIWTNVISQSDYDAVVNERDAVHAKFGSNLIAVANGVANVSVNVETSDDLSIWTTGGTASATVDVNSDSQFIRFSMTDNPDSLSDVSQLSHTQSWSQETSYKRVALIKYPNSDAQSHPVLIVLHGAGSNAYSMMSRYLNLDSYILVALQGYDNRWNIQTESTEADDLDYIKNIIIQLKTYSDVDANNISLLGSSNGAAMVNRAMIELPAGTFKNAITLASQLSTDQYNSNTFWGDDNNDGVYDTSYTLSQDLRVLSLHGTNDTTIPYDGGTVNWLSRTFIAAQQSILNIATSLGYAGAQVSGTAPFTNTNIIKYEYLGGDAIHYQFIGGNHGFGGFNDDVLNIVDDFISDGI
jgi:poly(3-hydroxybutyrate) depolymerase